MKPGLTMYVAACSDLATVCAEAQRIADLTDRAVDFHFNSVRCVAQPGGTAEKLAANQQEASRSELVVYSDTAKIEIELDWDQR